MGDVVDIRGGPFITHRKHKACGRMIAVDRLVEHSEQCARLRGVGEAEAGPKTNAKAKPPESEASPEVGGLGTALREAAERADRIETAGNKLVDIAGTLLGELAEVGEKALVTGSKVMDKADAIGEKVKRVTGWQADPEDEDEDP